MTTSAFTRPRQEAGTPAGGEFKAYGHSDAVPSLTGRRSAPATSNQHVPESLRMAHFQDPKLVSELEWAVERSLEDDMLADYHAENFGDALAHLHYEESAHYFSQALGDNGATDTERKRRMVHEHAYVSAEGRPHDPPHYGEDLRRVHRLPAASLDRPPHVGIHTCRHPDCRNRNGSGHPALDVRLLAAHEGPGEGHRRHPQRDGKAGPGYGLWLQSAGDEDVVALLVALRG